VIEVYSIRFIDGVSCRGGSSP